MISIPQLEHRVGEEVAVSPWVEISQERIDTFARAIDDPQWIHVDRERAQRSPFGGTIAHGFLTLSLLSHLSERTFSFAERKMGVNYGLNRVRFTAPVPSGSRVRARFTLKGFERLADGGIQVTWNTVVEREGSDKPVLIAEWLGRHYY
ncbi:MAG TPA: MaoC family dehydratase [Burkholderiales bacterium]|nr:MaoC family dehydratase [Burkholderiales bacterium]